MSALRQAVEDYITLRRALGSKLERHPRLLENFAGYLEAAGATTITIELALSWVRLPGDDANPAYLSNRLCAVRGFARHLQAFDPATEVPPARLLPWPKCRAAPSSAASTWPRGGSRSPGPRWSSLSRSTADGPRS
jgi:hypothetical protein